MRFLITGGAGFIGSAFVRHIIDNTSHHIVNVDCLTYAGNLSSLTEVSDSDRYTFEQINICDKAKIEQAFNNHKPDIIVHMAAESHVDRSIDGPAEFIQTNIVGTSVLLEVSRAYWGGLSNDKKASFRFQHISTDEVYGDLAPADPPFTETTPYDPSSPYSASKASSDHLVRAWGKTFGLPILITNCSNNYGPYQFPEKLIPVVILKALAGDSIPIYGKGDQIRDWLFVDDHVKAICEVAINGRTGETYNVGGHNEIQNIDVVLTICALLEELVPEKPNGVKNYADLITYVTDRPGHDVRYAIDAKKIKDELAWLPEETFESGIRKTIEWYLNNLNWCNNIKNNSYKRGHVNGND